MPSDNDELRAVVVELDQDPDEVRAFWTPERLRQARPFEREEIAIEAEPRTAEEPENEASGDVAPQQRGVPERADITTYPFTCAGRVHVNVSDTHLYLGSGQVVGHKKILLTAAHVVINASTGEPYDSIAFHRAYADGNSPQVLVATRVAWWKSVFVDAKSDWDYAFLLLDNECAAGHLGLETYTVPAAGWTSIGYPGNYDNNRFLYRVEGGDGGRYDHAIKMSDNPMQQGSSGGAWLHKASNVIGVNAHFAEGAPRMHGPEFDEKAMELFRMIAPTLVGERELVAALP